MRARATTLTHNEQFGFIGGDIGELNKFKLTSYSS